MKHCPRYPQEYEERLAQLRADYEAEQESRARLEEDITAMRNSYDVKLSTLEESLRKGTGGRPPGQLGEASPLPASISCLAFVEHLVRTRVSSIYSSQQPSEGGATMTLIL